MTIQEVSKAYGFSAETLRYYERVGVIPPVTQTAGGIRSYTEEDLKWVENAKCMRAAGISVEALAEYLRLFRVGDGTIQARLDLLREQRELLLEQQAKLAQTVERLNYKISRYEIAVQTGVLDWKN